MERVGLADQSQRPGRVWGEDREVLVGRGAEEPKYDLAGPLNQLGHRRRGRVDRVRVPEHVRAKQLEVLAELPVGIKAGARVVEIDVAAGVEPREVAAAQLVEDGGVVVAR